ncbi:MAG: DUF350 domain-containing protein [Myxococcales bacterium]|nr:DUF350 domain-containing protein [Myxococcales bacterium]
MTATYILVSLFDFLLTGGMSVLVIYVHYRLYIITNSDYDAAEELRKGNIAVAVLLSAMLIGGGMIVKEGIYPVVNLVRLKLTAPTLGLSGVQVGLFAVGHVFLVFLVAVFTLSMGLRVWGRLARGSMCWGDELKKGNTAVGIVLAGVVLVFSAFMSGGVSHLTKSLIPQPSMGQVEIME